MRRSRRGRMINWGLIFVVYSAIQVYSASIKESLSDAGASIKPTEEFNTSPNPSYEYVSTTEKYETTEFKELLSTAKTTTHHRHTHPTYRPKRENCTPPAIEQFPPPLMGPNIRKHGGLIIHVLVAVFTFLGLAIVCDDYFVSSLDRICEGTQFWNILKIKSIYYVFILYRTQIVTGCSWCYIYGSR